MTLRPAAFAGAAALTLLLLGPAVTDAAGTAILAGDRLNVHVYNHPELSTVAVVDSRGTVQLPVVGTIHVAGRTSRDVAAEIQSRVAAYIPYPAVDVEDTSESQTIFVTGGPGGVLPYQPNETLSAAVAEVGKALNFSDTSQTPPNAPLDKFDRSRIDLRRVKIYRDGNEVGSYDMIALRNAGDPGPALFANDTVAFANKPVEVTVLGAVTMPGPAYLWPNEPLSDAVAQAGGPALTAASGHVRIDQPGAPPLNVALGDGVFNEPTQPGTVVTIPTAPRVTVEGLVEKPGAVILPNDFTLLAAVAAAGGYNKYGDLRKVQVVHQGVRHEFNMVALAHGDMSQNPVLHDGDSVFVPEGYKIDWQQIFNGIGALSGFGYDILHY